jgi:glucan phosphoethanolaminetransferase (alkaline phosphatase superfamily)
MYAAPGRRLPPTPSSLTARRPLSIHFVCHLAALALLALAVVTDSERVAAAGALVGGVGAAAFAMFFWIVLKRMSAPDLKTGRREASAG